MERKNADKGCNDSVFFELGSEFCKHIFVFVVEIDFWFKIIIIHHVMLENFPRGFLLEADVVRQRCILRAWDENW